MKGKNKCRILKEIRKAIAKENDIEYVTSECKYQGECIGTCPKCESEVKYLEAELEKRRSAGKSVVVAGIAASMILSTGCVSMDDFLNNQFMGDLKVNESFEQLVSEASQSEIYSEVTQGELVDGEMMIRSYEETTEVTTGEELSSNYNESEDITEEMGEPLFSEEDIVLGEVAEIEN